MTNEQAHDTSPKPAAEREGGDPPEPYPADPGQRLEPEPEPTDDAFAEPDHWVGGRRRPQA